MEEASKSSLSFVAKQNRTTATFSELESKKLNYLKNMEGIVIERQIKKKQRKTIGGPNPLSCKKKKTEKKTEIKPENMISKKKRIRVKIPKHVQ